MGQNESVEEYVIIRERREQPHGKEVSTLFSACKRLSSYAFPSRQFEGLNKRSTCNGGTLVAESWWD